MGSPNYLCGAIYALMAILKIARMGHPVLLAPAREVADPVAPEVAALLADMAETLDDAGGVGLAGPQVHAGLRLFIYKVPASRAEGGDEVPLTAVINPVVTPLGDAMALGWEGCLSIPGLRAAVPRFERVRLTGLDAAGAPIDKEISGFEARVVQHEADHLDGVLYTMRLADFRYFGFNEETLRYDFPLPNIVRAGHDQ
jgi:peptide deformylase